MNEDLLKDVMVLELAKDCTTSGDYDPINLHSMNQILFKETYDAIKSKLESIQPRVIIDQEILNILTNTYGLEMQFIKALEEMTELSKELLKHMQHNDRKDKIMDEMSDVLITLENVRLILGIDIEEINKNIEFKLDRAMKIITKEES